MEIRTNYSANNSQQSCQNFGAARAVPKAEELVQITAMPLDEAKNLIAMITKVASDVDIFTHAGKEGLTFYMEKINPSGLNLGNKLLRLVKHPVQFFKRIPIQSPQISVTYRQKGFSTEVITAILKEKNKFLGHNLSTDHKTPVTSVTSRSYPHELQKATV